MIATEAGRWIVPSERAVWIPAGMQHDVHAFVHVSTRSLYVERDVKKGLPGDCRVIGISPLMWQSAAGNGRPAAALEQGSRTDLIFCCWSRK